MVIGKEEGVAESPRRRVRLTASATLLGAVLLIGAALLYDRASASHFFPGTRIGGVLIGSRSIEDADALLRERWLAQLKQPIALKAPGITRHASPWTMGLRIDLSKALRGALATQERMTLVERVWRRVIGYSRNISLRPELEEQRLRAFLSKAVKRIDRPVRDASLVIEEGNLKVVPHRVGRQVDVVGAEQTVVRALSAGHRRVKLPVHVTKPELRTKDFSKIVLVRTGSNRLEYYKKGKLKKSYPVATGTPGYPTPAGQFRIVGKRMYPSWTNPGSEWAADMPPYIPPGPNNPLGTRAMYLSASGIRIHGTPHANSIGRPASHGCIRMFMSDAEDLFERVDVGTPVVVRF